jgi:glycosyltransferase involved in cell wall biosynthesis
VLLSAIVYNEASCIAECLDTFLGVIDKVVFTDTGSTDGTPEVVRAWMQKNNIPGIVYECPWPEYAAAQCLPTRKDGSPALFDFARARNLSVSLAQQHAEDTSTPIAYDDMVRRTPYADQWLLEIDGAWKLRGGVNQLRAGLASAPHTTTAFELMVNHNGSSVPYLRLRRVSECGPGKWMWRAPIHEYLWRQDNAEIGRIEGIWIEHTDTAETAANRQARLLRDLAIFDELIEDYEARNVGAWPFNDHERGEYTRAYFFRGQTHENLHEWSPAYEDYKKRAELKGAVFEWSQACYRAGRVAQRMAETEQQNEVLPYWRGKALGWYLESFAVGGRPEGLWEASAIYRASGDTDSAENAAWLAFEAAKGQKPDASSGFSYPEAFALASFGPVRDTAMISARIRAMSLMGVPFPGKVTG